MCAGESTLMECSIQCLNQLSYNQRDKVQVEGVNRYLNVAYFEPVRGSNRW